MTLPALPADLAEISAEFLDLAPATRLELLVEFGAEVREVPEPFASNLDLMERVVECQSPVYVVVEVTPVPGHDARAAVHIAAPKEAPTTRGFAGVLSESLGDLTAREILALPADLPRYLGLETLVSPLRLAGMASMLGVRSAISWQTSSRTASRWIRASKRTCRDWLP